MAGEVVLEVKDLKTQFFTRDGVVKAVDGVTFSVHSGEVVGLVGESGCGKSMTALSIMRLIPQPPGKIVNGQVILHDDKMPRDLLQLDESEMQHIRGRVISMIFQDPMTSLNPVLTIGYQLTEPLKIHFNMSDDHARKRAIALLMQVGIPAAAERLNDYPHQFSGGMRQRVMVAMSLACDPRMLIADEPTTALDVTVQAQLLELIKALNRDTGTAVLIITHDLGVVADLCDRVMVMYAGQIIESGTGDEIFDNPQHPYTVGLMQSVPRLGPTVRNRLVPIEGLPPDLIAPPSGCRFRPRCPHAFAKCVETPPSVMLGGDHVSSCWLAVEGVREQSEAEAARQPV
ncbi:MAG: ABC transporter ATP-binding protein [Chloroflexi bacterium]|nr:ABC transporter ATP-binding protein [Chloroflexota bacterium]